MTNKNKGVIGGIPSKLGNRYEAKWLVRCFLDVISGEASWLKFEGVSIEYEGFEFAIQYNDIIQWHQTKINAPGGNWTIDRLEKVLANFKARLSEERQNHCCFVSQDNANDLRTLAEKSRLAENYSQYYNDCLSADDKNNFNKIKQKWNCSKEQGFEWLTRIYVRILPDKEIESLVESYSDLYFQSGRKLAFPILRDLLENKFNKQITTETAREAIRSETHLTLKDWSLDPTIRQRLAETTKDYLATYSPFGAGGAVIPRKQSQEIVDELFRPDGAELILLTGVAGSGKSGVVRSVIEQLKQKQILHLAFRVDHHLEYRTSEELGKTLTQREENPVATLKGTEPTQQSVLIIDQLDAVSEVSGRDGKVREVIFKMISTAHHFGSIRVIVICRTFDLDGDARFKELKNKNKTKQVEVPSLDWETEVKPLLTEKNITINLFSERQQALLKLPVNLAIFLELDEDRFNFTSRSSLFDRLVEQKQRKITKLATWSLLEPLFAMSEWMSQRQQLDTPKTILDKYNGAVSILCSEGLIVSSRTKLNFFHESFFDYLYARSFVNSRESLRDLLLSTAQHLFRRTQVRQILDSLRQNDFERYLQELTGVLHDERVRFHIKIAISQWLSSIEEPTVQEFDIIIKLDEPKSEFNQLIGKSLLNSAEWFPLLNKKRWIQQQLEQDNQSRQERILRWLADIAGQQPDEIAQLLRTWWQKNPSERAKKLFNWFGFIHRQKPDEQLFKLCENVIRAHAANLPIDFFESQTQNNHQLDGLFYAWRQENAVPEFGSRLLHLLLEIWFDIHPDKNPFIQNRFINFEHCHYLTEILRNSPLGFLKATTKTLVRSVNMSMVNEGEETNESYHFKYRHYSGYRSGFDSFLNIYRRALQQIAKESSDQALEYLNQLDATKHECFMHLHLETICVNPQYLNNCLIKLLHYPTLLFSSGWGGAEWQSFADAAHAVMPFLSQQDRQKVEDVILSYHSEVQYAVARLRLHRFKRIKRNYDEFKRLSKSIIFTLQDSGKIQWSILETIGEALLTQQTLFKLFQLRRKFPKQEVPKPNEVRFSSVESPIKRSQCERMTDKNLLKAIQRYSSEDERKRGVDFVIGGAEQFAGQFHNIAEKFPNRFSKLCLLIPYTAHVSYVKNILSGLAATEDCVESELSQVIYYAHGHPDKPFGTEIVRLIEKYPTLAKDSEILEILIWYAQYGKVYDENEKVDLSYVQREIVTIEVLLEAGDGVYQRGINGTRGQSWESIASVLWKIPEIAPRVWTVLDEALNHEKLISVRCCMLRTFMPLFNEDIQKFSKALQKLIGLSEDSSQKICLLPLATHFGMQFFSRIFYWLPELAEKLVELFLSSPDKNMSFIGAWIVFQASFYNESQTISYVERSDKLMQQSVEHRRLLAYVTARVINTSDDRHRAERLTKSFFIDEDEQVRKQISVVFRYIPLESDNYRDIASQFIKSPAFVENPHFFLDSLEKATCDVCDLIVDSAQILLKTIVCQGRQLYMFHDLEVLLKREYVSSENNLTTREKLLDLVDLMLKHEIYGVEKIIQEHER